MSEPTHAYTAARIAAVLGRKRQTIQWMLRHSPPSECLLINGNQAQVWRISALPTTVVAQLENLRERKGFKDIHALLTAPVTAWTAPVAVQAVKPQFLEKAIKLRDALEKPLAKQHELSAAELIELGRREYARVFGHSISAKHWRRVFDRTMDRDRGSENFSRLEIYIDESAFRQQLVPVESLKRGHLHKELGEIAVNLENKAHPTPDDRAWVFGSALEHYQRLIANLSDRHERHAIKASLVDYLFSAMPGLSKTRSALLRTFELKLSKWENGGHVHRALDDARRCNSGNFRRPDFSADLEKIRNLAIEHGGNESLAHRLLRRRGELSDAFLQYYSFDARQDKSYVPKTVRSDITHKVDMTEDIYSSPWKAKMRGPYIPRDWSDVQPFDFLSGDDVTLNHYFYFYDDAGQLHIERGECLVMTDLRTEYPLDFVLIAGKYNGRFIRNLMTKVHDKHGLPHVGVYFEKGVWASRWIQGENSKSVLHWRETELGLRERGVDLQVRHATTPKAKTIEGAFRILEERQRSEPGFCGFNERTEKMERLQEFIIRARKGKEHPGNELLEMGEWCKRINEILWELGNDPQNGKRLQGRSPAEAFEEAQNKRPARKLPEEARYLLATHKKILKVRKTGIHIKIHKYDDHIYCNERTGELIGRDVLAFYNIDYPDVLTVSDLNRQNFFTVKRLNPLPAMSATREQFAEAKKAINGHMAHAKAIYGAIPHRVVSTVTRDGRLDEATSELGRFHNAAEAEAKAEISAENRKIRKIKMAAAVGEATVNLELRNPDRVLAGIELEKQVRERLAAKELSETITPNE